ncbi:MAG: hypothetical protein ABI577_03100 [bacterium]
MAPSPFSDAERTTDQESLRDRALDILRRHGYSSGDLDFLLYEGQGGTPGDDDPELEEAIGILGTLRERGINPD